MDNSGGILCTPSDPIVQPKQNTRSSPTTHEDNPCLPSELKGLEGEAFDEFDHEFIDCELKRVRLIYKNEEERVKHEWTAREKGMVHLDWFRHPELYYDWTPAETDDILYMHKTTLMFAYSHLATTVLKQTAVFCKFLPFSFPHPRNGIWKTVLTLQRIPNEQFLAVHCVWKPIGLSESVVKHTENNREVSEYGPVISSNDAQIISSNHCIDTPSVACNFAGAFPVTALHPLKLQKHTISMLVTGFTFLVADRHVEECGTTTSDKGRLYGNALNTQPRVLVALLFSDFTFSVYDLTTWIHEEIAKLKASQNLQSMQFASSTLDENAMSDFCITSTSAICIFESTRLGILQKDEKITAFQYGTGFRCSSKRRCLDMHRASTCFVYTRYSASKQILPTHIGVVIAFVSEDEKKKKFPTDSFLSASSTCAGKIFIFDISSYIENREKCVESTPICSGYFPIGCAPTGISGIPGYCSGNSISQIYPQFVTCDEGGYLRIWKISNFIAPDIPETIRCFCMQRVSMFPLLSVAVNQKHPYIIAYGNEFGLVKIYDLRYSSFPTSSDAYLSNVASTSHDTSSAEINADLCTLQRNGRAAVAGLLSPATGNVLEYHNRHHPVLKIQWIGHTFLGVHYGEPFTNKESSNGSFLALWRLSRDIYSGNDAFLQSKYWNVLRGPAGEQEEYLHMFSRLTCMHGGHASSAEGVLGSDFIFCTQGCGLCCISSDGANQLHFFKPNLCMYADCDDPLAFGRLTGDVNLLESWTRSPPLPRNLRRNLSSVSSYAHLSKKNRSPSESHVRTTGSLPGLKRFNEIAPTTFPAPAACLDENNPLHTCLTGANGMSETDFNTRNNGRNASEGVYNMSSEYSASNPANSFQFDPMVKQNGASPSMVNGIKMEEEMVDNSMKGKALLKAIRPLRCSKVKQSDYPADMDLEINALRSGAVLSLGNELEKLPKEWKQQFFLSTAIHKRAETSYKKMRADSLGMLAYASPAMAFGGDATTAFDESIRFPHSVNFSELNANSTIS
ncbi:hypothetical protein IE077_002334 [Cardiosporidium cionae]|uniref:Uncharacterized protein n=1 Tax=Cardiosporidium cionae TaxID=476202 RepID=A0ABQ7JB11_9APIC|nr:hypothetical protein IE077_002334 [Cardiosporidium cionae]|eukprot:KAF8821195.1 hypothetical protein IE077_002334 [Cardiosporidium cionae]